ncbi:hypothetical protein F7234_06380 [Pseudomonas putida]|uniref:hypothetical protein n=1 Tax=Pseudomonas putida TaxID=303 RepID=UPI0012600B36|nr:hypothetical protein [Pseudomonas putida]KAB5625415.1 hypothetical protein F7234_06380 [Pseudomonas putida]
MYRNAIVTFLDVLGFRSLIKHESAGEINIILEKMSRHAAPPSDDDDYQPTITTFSDCVVRTSFVDSEANTAYPIGLLFYELLGLVHAQSALVHDGVIVRGALAFGNIFHQGQRVFGPAMVEAYELESSKAIYPRILVSSEWLKMLNSNRLIRSKNNTLKEEVEHILRLIRKDNDGEYFVDYIRAIQGELDDPEAGYVEFLKKHCLLIKKNLKRYADGGGVFEKYEWLSRYHDERIEELDEAFLKYYDSSKRLLLTGK